MENNKGLYEKYEFKIFDDKPYKLDLDKNNFPTFTKKNIEFVTAILNYDSSYRASFDEDDEESSAYLLTNKKFPKTEEELKKVVERIDKENSTHLIVSGNEKVESGDNKNKQGIIKTVRGMMDNIGLENLKKSIEDGDVSIVQKIALFVPNRYNISFASKFCAYTNRYCFNKDDYSIYDSVLSKILPYYSYVYLGKEEKQHWKRITRTIDKRNETIIPDEFANKDKAKKDIEFDGYQQYNELIGRIINKANKTFGFKVTRKGFDFLLWYYFKGSDRFIRKANEYLGKSDSIIDPNLR